MRVRLSLCLVLYHLATFSSSQKVAGKRQVVVGMKCPPHKCINIRTTHLSDPPRRCCGRGVDPSPITPGGQAVPSFLKLTLTSTFDDNNAAHTEFFVEGQFSPENTGPVSTPGCIGWYDLGNSRSEDLAFDDRYYLIGEDDAIKRTDCGSLEAVEGPVAERESPNPYYMPSLNPIQRAIDESNLPFGFRGYKEPSNPSIFLNPGSSIENPFTSAAAPNPDDPLNPGIPIAPGSLLSQEIAPLKLASTPDFDLSLAGSGCTGVDCQVPPVSWSELNLNVRKKRTSVELQA